LHLLSREIIPKLARENEYLSWQNERLRKENEELKTAK
jgi:hypothetical protein